MAETICVCTIDIYINRVIAIFLDFYDPVPELVLVSDCVTMAELAHEVVQRSVPPRGLTFELLIWKSIS